MTTNYFRAALIVSLLLTASSGWAREKTITIVEGAPKQFNDDQIKILSSRVDGNEAKIRTVADARAMINATLFATFEDHKPNIDDQNFYCIIHVLRWKDSDSNNEQKVDKQHWYVYRGGDWTDADLGVNNRLFGVKKFWFLYVHLNKLADAKYSARYDAKVTEKEIAPLQHAFELARIFALLGARSSLHRDVWGCGDAPVPYNPSDIAITPYVTPEDKPDTILNAQVFDNEGKYRFDFSAGIPVRRISQLEFDSKGETVTAKKVDKQNVFALFDYYFAPVDVKNPVFSWKPYFVGGVAIAKQPLHKILVGAGFGPRFVNFYAGALWVKQDKPATLKEGQMATPDQLNADLRRRYKAQFTFGINVPVRSIANAFKKSE